MTSGDVCENWKPLQEDTENQCRPAIRKQPFPSIVFV